MSINYSDEIKRKLTEVVHSVTVEDVMVNLLRDPALRDQIRHSVPGDSIVVHHDYGSFNLSTEEAKQLMALLRLRGKIPAL